MISKFAWFLCLVVCLGSSSYGIVLPAPGLLDDYMGVRRSPYYRVTLGTPEVRLHRPTHIKADEVIVNGLIVTQGHSLTIDARRLEFRSGAKIVGFTNPQKPVSDVPPTARKGEFGGDENRHIFDVGTIEEIKRQNGGHVPFPIRFLMDLKGHGGHGGKGYDGVEGYSGMSGCDPSGICIFASEIVGRPVIDGQGQTGGRGGKGGKGGAGGNGGRGKKADGGNIFGGASSACNGGDSGPRGSGGKGGKGGRGGNAIPIIVLNSKNLLTLERLETVRSKPGKGGEGGCPGEMGDPGAAGSGGGGDSSWCVVSTRTMGSGANGRVITDDAVPKNFGYGEKGSNGARLTENHTQYLPYTSSGVSLSNDAVYKFYQSLEGRRVQVANRWYRFHWARILKLLFEESYTLALDYQNDQMGLLELLSTDRVTDVLGLSSPNPELSEEIATAWETQFLEPLEAQIQSRMRTSLTAKYLRIGRPILAGLREIATSQNVQAVVAHIEGARQEINSLYQTTLDQALSDCVRYNRQIESLNDEIFGKTSHFYVPVCMGEPDLRNPENLLAEYHVYRPYELRVPDGIQYQLINSRIEYSPSLEIAFNNRSPFQIFSTFMAHLVYPFLGVQNAAASGEGDPEVDPYFQAMKMKDLFVQTQIPGLKMISKKEAHENMKLYLRILSELAGR